MFKVGPEFFQADAEILKMFEEKEG